MAAKSRTRVKSRRSPGMRSGKAFDSPNAYREMLSGRLFEAIETERGRLETADSLLGCFVTSLKYDEDEQNGPYFPDVAELARSLVKKAINGLDSVALQQHFEEHKSKR